MNANEISLQATLKPDGTLVLDSKPNLPPGRVVVVLRPESQGISQPGDWWLAMQSWRRNLESTGAPFMNDEEVLSHMAWLREADAIDSSLRLKE